MPEKLFKLPTVHAQGHNRLSIRYAHGSFRLYQEFAIHDVSHLKECMKAPRAHASRRKITE